MWGHYNPCRIKDWESAKKWFARARDPHAGRPLENNTRLHREGDKYIIRFHRTHVVTYLPNGNVILRTGGWNTITTRARICSYSPVTWISTCQGVWYMRWQRHTYVFEDCVLLPDKRRHPRMLFPEQHGGRKWLMTSIEEARHKAEVKQAERFLPKAARLLLKHGMLPRLGKSMVLQLESHWNQHYADALNLLQYDRKLLEQRQLSLNNEESRLTALRDSALTACAKAEAARDQLRAIQAAQAEAAAAAARYNTTEVRNGKYMRPIQLDEVLS